MKREVIKYRNMSLARFILSETCCGKNAEAAENGPLFHHSVTPLRIACALSGMQSRFDFQFEFLV
jgi:hypothetical protein